MRPMFRHGGWPIFATGVLCGVVFAAAVWAGSTWWKLSPERLAQDSAIYDYCLMEEHGNTVACDAMMRQIERQRTAEAAMKAQAARLLAAGFSKREVVKWAADQGFVGSQLSDAVGISLQDLQAGKYRYDFRPPIGSEKVR
jgi:hypothetical protein